MLHTARMQVQAAGSWLLPRDIEVRSGEPAIRGCGLFDTWSVSSEVAGAQRGDSGLKLGVLPSVLVLMLTCSATWARHVIF